MINRILHSCSCIIEFIKLVAKRGKMLGKPRILSLFPTRLINSIKHEHSCKILYVICTVASAGNLQCVCSHAKNNPDIFFVPTTYYNQVNMVISENIQTTCYPYAYIIRES